MKKITWKVSIRRILQVGGKLSLSDIYERIKPFADEKNNHHWQAKVRQCLQDESLFMRVEKGVYELAR